MARELQAREKEKKELELRELATRARMERGGGGSYVPPPAAARCFFLVFPLCGVCMPISASHVCSTS